MNVCIYIIIYITDKCTPLGTFGAPDMKMPPSVAFLRVLGGDSHSSGTFGNFKQKLGKRSQKQTEADRRKHPRKLP